MKKTATAVAHSNIALVKYWGKRDTQLNLPAVGSISITLGALHTSTTVTFQDNLTSDRLFLSEQAITGGKLERVSGFLDLVRHMAGISAYAEVYSHNNFPTGAGLASSASAFAALALAATKAGGLDIASQELTILSRKGSGSAARSVFGGFVEMHKGSLADGSDAYATQLQPPEFWDLRIIIAITTEEEKRHGSTDGMQLSAKTSPYYKEWVQSSDFDLKEMRKAIELKDIQKLGELSEHSCMKMHALMLSSRPALVYWNTTTMAIIHLAEELRGQGIPVYVTIDAGPQVKLLTLPEHQDAVAAAVQSVPEVKRIITSQLGPDAYVEQKNV